MKTKWNFQGDYWVPLTGQFKETLFLLKENIQVSDREAINLYLKEICSGFAFLINEDMDDYEVAKELIDVNCYEQFIIDNSGNWLVYGSHEGTVAFGGEVLSGYVAVLFEKRQQLLNKW